MHTENSTRHVKTGLAFLLGKWMKYFSEGHPEAIETITYLVTKSCHAGIMDTVENIPSGVGFYVNGDNQMPVMPDETHFFTSFDYAVAYWTGLGKQPRLEYAMKFDPGYTNALASEIEIIEMLGKDSFSTGSVKSELFKPSLLLIDDNIIEDLKKDDLTGD